MTRLPCEGGSGTLGFYRGSRRKLHRYTLNPKASQPSFEWGLGPEGAKDWGFGIQCLGFLGIGVHRLTAEESTLNPFVFWL